MKFRLAIVAGAAAVLMTGDAAWAQRRADPEPASVRRPYRGLFNTADDNSPHSLLLSASLYAAYDDNILAALAERDIRQPWLQKSGFYGGATARLSYAFDVSNDRMGFRGHAGAQATYYRRGSDSNTLPSGQADVVYNTRLTPGLNFTARQSVAYSSNYSYSMALGLDPADFDGHDIAYEPNPDLDLFELEAFRATSTLGLSQSLGRNLSVGGSFSYRRVDVLNRFGAELASSRFRDYDSKSASARIHYSRPMTRYADLQIGYSIRATDKRGHVGEPNTMHNIIAGVDYSRPLSISRRTSVSFGTGSTIARTERLDEPEADPRMRAQLIGHAMLVHEIGRTWTAQAGYSRGYRTRDGFDDLYLTDSLGASVGGLFTRAWSFSAQANWTLAAGDRPGNNNARGMTATAQTQYSVSRFLGFYARYIYYAYRQDEDVASDGRVPGQLDRQGVRVGLTTAIPLIR